MKKITLIAVLSAIMVLMCSVFAFAEGTFELKTSYPEDGQKNMSMENLGVKLTFSKSLNSKEAVAVNQDKFSIVDEEGEKVPIMVLFSDDVEGLVLVLADIDKGFVAKNNTEYTLTVDEGLVDDEGDVLGSEQKISFKTYNQKVNNMINMGMMFVMFGGIMVFSLRQNTKKEEEEEPEEPKEAFNPYKEAKKTGKTVEEVQAEQAKKEEKEARKKARRKKKAAEEVPEKKIENCAELLNNVYHVHAPAPTNKEDRSIEGMKAARKAEAKAARAAKAEAERARARKKR